MEQPNIIVINQDQVESVKSSMLMAFSSDPFIRWLFPNPNDYLKNFSIWMDEFISTGLPVDINSSIQIEKFFK